MNSKKCRVIRQMIKKEFKSQHDIDLESIHATYDTHESRTPYMIIHEGKALKALAVTFVKTLTMGCPRQIYKFNKRKLKKEGF